MKKQEVVGEWCPPRDGRERGPTEACGRRAVGGQGVSLLYGTVHQQRTHWTILVLWSYGVACARADPHVRLGRMCLDEIRLSSATASISSALPLVTLSMRRCGSGRHYCTLFHKGRLLLHRCTLMSSFSSRVARRRAWVVSPGVCMPFALFVWFSW